MNSRAGELLILAAIFLTIGLTAGLWPHSDEVSDQVERCGSPFRPETDIDDIDNTQAFLQCTEARNAAKPWAFGGVLLAGIAVIGAVASPTGRRNDAES